MIIDSYAITAGSQRSYEKVEYERLGIDLLGAGTVTNPAQAAGEVEQAQIQPVTITLSDYAKQMLEQSRGNTTNLQTATAAGTAGVAPGQGAPQTKEELKLQMLENFLYALSGKRVNLNIFDVLRGHRAAQRPTLRMQNPAAAARAGITVRHEQFQYEKESMSYAAQGVVKTADGKTIHMDLSLSMSREAAQYSSTRLEFGPPRNLVDPLVINYGGTAASLTGEKFAFDLDANGTTEQISFAGAGSGFLALDKNGDRQINDGSELFGPGTGNGFGELRTHDGDGNGWIDEADAVFSQLRIWSKDASGKDQLFTLQELGVGAIYLGDVSTEFSLTDGANNTQGVMRSTSFFLRENGSAGTVHHIDLSV